MCSDDEERPNVLMVITHDQGTHLGCYDRDLETPELDKAAEEGVKFNNHFCTAPQCSPSRGSIMTGLYPHNHGLIGLAQLGWSIDGEHKKLPEYLKDWGYDTHLFGLQHEAMRGETLGYEHVHHPIDYQNIFESESEQKNEKMDRNPSITNASKVAEDTCAFLESYSEKDPNSPFFASIGLFEPHRPYGGEDYDSDNPSQVKPSPYLPNRDGIQQDIADFNGMVYRVDEVVGQIRSTLQKTSLEKETLFVFTTDHGIAMPRAKGTCYDPGVETALIFTMPEKIEGNQAREELLSNVDLLPTLLDFVGSIPKKVEDIDGRSFLPLLTGGGDYSPRDHIFCEMTWHDTYNPVRAVRTNRYKYIKNFSTSPEVFMPFDVYKGAAGQEMQEEYYESSRPKEELYDLVKDPWEKNNLVREASYSVIKKELKTTLVDWMERTNDPLLQGPVPPTDKQKKVSQGRPN